MMPRPTPALRWSAAALAVTTLALGGLGAGIGSADQIVSAGFATALDAARAPNATLATASRPGLAQLSGSEEFWLGSAVSGAGTVPVAFTEPVALGDRITITSGGRARQLEVVDLRPLGGDHPAGGPSKHTSPLLLVTCRDAELPDARPVRFVIEKDAGLPDTLQRVPRTL